MREIRRPTRAATAQWFLLLHASRANEALLPVSDRVALNADDAARARRVNELVAAECDPNMRCTTAHRFEKDQIPRLHRVAANGGTELVLVLDGTRQSHAMLCEDPLHESAAIEARWIATAVPVGDAAIRKSGLEQCRALLFRNRGQCLYTGGRRGFRKRSRRGAL